MPALEKVLDDFSNVEDLRLTVDTMVEQTGNTPQQVIDNLIKQLRDSGTSVYDEAIDQLDNVVRELYNQTKE